MNDPEAIWQLDGDHAIPTELARGPWSPDAQHGGAPSSLLAGMLERFEPGPADFTARLNIDLMRPVPLVPLRIERTVIRPGKKVQIVQGSLFADDTEVVRATALRIRVVEPRYDDIVATDTSDALPPPGDAKPFPFLAERDVGFWHAVEVSEAIGTFGAPEPIRRSGTEPARRSGTEPARRSGTEPARRSGTEPAARTAVWFRLRVPVIAGEVPSPLQRVAAVADFGNGMGMAVDRSRYSFINPDLTIVLHRLPVGEWVALDGTSYAEDTGVGVAESELHDERGRIGRGMQTVILDRRTEGLFGGSGGSGGSVS